MADFISLTLNGLSTGMMIFLLAAGLSIIFGLMGVLNFAHGSIFMWGAYTSVLLMEHTGNFVIGMLGGVLMGALIGWILERFAIRRVYGQPILQILLTTGLMLVLNELVKAVFGPNIIAVSVPHFLEGSWLVGNIAIVKYRIFTLTLGALVAALGYVLLTRTRVGTIVRAGVENPEMLQVLGINIRRTFAFVFVLGAALAALGGVIMAPSQGAVNPSIGIDNQILAFIVVVVGGMGSFLGTALGAVLVGLIGSYVAWFFPEAAMAVNVLLMAIVLLVKPSGLFGGRSEVRA